MYDLALLILNPTLILERTNSWNERRDPAAAQAAKMSELYVRAGKINAL